MMVMLHIMGLKEQDSSIFTNARPIREGALEDGLNSLAHRIRPRGENKPVLGEERGPLKYVWRVGVPFTFEALLPHRTLGGSLADRQLMMSMSALLAHAMMPPS